MKLIGEVPVKIENPTVPAVIQGMAGTLYCGDNLEVLDEYIPDESVDLIYLDPPFNSKRTYNIVYKDSRAQEEAFKDYWSWAELSPHNSVKIKQCLTAGPVIRS